MKQNQRKISTEVHGDMSHPLFLLPIVVANKAGGGHPPLSDMRSGSTTSRLSMKLIFGGFAVLMSTAKPPNMSFILNREVVEPDLISERGGCPPPALFATTMGSKNKGCDISP